MIRRVQLWSRDEEILREIGRSPLLRNQVGRLFCFPQKKCGERLFQLFRAGLVRRLQYFQTGMKGRAEFVYYGGRCPSRELLRHTITVAELRVQCARSFPDDHEFQASFFYGHELPTMGKLRADAGLAVQRADRAALVLLEADLATERLTSPTSYSLLGKLQCYATYFDSGEYQKDFAFAGVLRGFRVALVLTSMGRLQNVQRLLSAAKLDFVLLATMTDITTMGLHAPVWRTHDNQLVDILGRSSHA